MTTKQLEKKYEDKMLVIDHARSWNESLQAAEQWYQGESIPSKRCYGISLRYAHTNSCYVPRKCFKNLKEIAEYLENL